MFHHFFITKKAIPLLTHAIVDLVRAIVDLVHTNSAIDSKKLQFAIDLPVASAIDPSILDL